jgi:hypothetical protein
MIVLKDSPAASSRGFWVYFRKCTNPKIANGNKKVSLPLRVKILTNSRAQAFKERLERETPGEFHADTRTYKPRLEDNSASGLEKLEEEVNKVVYTLYRGFGYLIHLTKLDSTWRTMTHQHHRDFVHHPIPMVPLAEKEISIIYQRCEDTASSAEQSTTGHKIFRGVFQFNIMGKYAYFRTNKFAKVN